MASRRDVLSWSLLAASVAALLANGAMAVSNTRAMDDAHAWVTHTHEVLENSQRLLSALQDAETGQRGFLITGAPAYLEPYESSVSRIHEQLGRLRELTRDNPLQQQRLDELRPLVERELAELRRTIEARKGKDGVEASRTLVMTDEGKALMDELRFRIADLADVELRLMDERARRFRVNSTAAVWGEVLGTVASVALVAWAFRLLVSRRRERERAAEMFAGEGERLRTTLTSIGDAVIVTDEAGRVTLLNKVAEDLTGWKRDEALGRPLSAVFRIINEETRQEVVSPVDRVLREGVMVGLANHTSLVARDGTERPIADSGAPIRDLEGRISGVVLVFRDQTEERRAVEALRTREAQFQTLIEELYSGVALIDASGRFTVYNRRFLELFGLSPEADIENVNSQNWAAWEVLDEAGRLLHVDKHPVRTVALTRRPVRNQLVAVRLPGGGDLKWVLVSAEPLFQKDGSLEQIICTYHEITARKLAEDALLRSRQGLSQLAEASLRVVRETDLQGMLQAISEAALVLTDARIATCGHGDVAGRTMVGGSARAAGAPACQPGEMFVLNRGGVHLDLVDGAEAIRLTDAQLRAHPRWWGGPAGHVPLRGLLGVRMVGRSGRANGMILVTDKAHGDFTEEDESLLRQLATIASLALQHVEARIAVEESDRSKNHFLAMLSHELRNPLAPIRNSLYLLDRTPAGGEAAKRAEAVIQRQVGHLTRLVDDLLDMTRISRGKIELQRERVDLSELIRRAIEDHRSMFDQNGLELHVELPADPLWIDGDRTRLVQVVGNLLQNSAKFTELGGRISVSLASNDDLRQAVLRVRDTGVGIERDMLARVFEPFAQADTTLARSKGGLGLGLALVKALVEMHGGDVTVESEGMGKGAEFVMRLPLDGELPEPLGVVAAAGVRPNPNRILIVEDNVDAADSLREVLELDGHVVEVAYSGWEGVEAARARPPEVVLCDIGLPGIDGYEVAQAIRRDPALRETRLVALTGYAAPEDVARSKAAGFDDHVAKPPNIEELRGMLAPKR